MSPNFNTYGVGMISTALLFDAIIGNVQEKAMREHKASNVEVVQYSYGIGFFYLLAVLILTGNLMSGLRFCATVCSEAPFLPRSWVSLITLTAKLSFFYFTVSDTNIWLRISIQFIRLSGHSVRVDAGAYVRCSAGGNSDNSAKSRHHYHFIYILRQTVQHSVSIYLWCLASG